LTFEILGESLSENDGLTTLEIGMGIAFGSQGSYFVVGPSMSVNDSNTWYGISVGISKEKF